MAARLLPNMTVPKLTEICISNEKELGMAKTRWGRRKILEFGEQTRTSGMEDEQIG